MKSSLYPLKAAAEIPPRGAPIYRSLLLMQNCAHRYMPLSMNLCICVPPRKQPHFPQPKCQLSTCSHFLPRTHEHTLTRSSTTQTPLSPNALSNVDSRVHLAQPLPSLHWPKDYLCLYHLEHSLTPTIRHLHVRAHTHTHAQGHFPNTAVTGLSGALPDARSPNAFNRPTPFAHCHAYLNSHICGLVSWPHSRAETQPSV